MMSKDNYITRNQTRPIEPVPPPIDTKRPVPEAFDQLEKAITMLSDRLSTLENILNPVFVAYPLQPETLGGKAIGAEKCQVAKKIEESTDRILNMVRQVQELTERIEL